ncbi:MAG: hypothetical protein JRG94_02480 [Deltaproteobacteria bacterium]|nr:hypothetical protein [Deltaproteobacteria bacterium]MBW2723554.1 hypothetical protein [Deltaproteobacteria bacterium]
MRAFQIFAAMDPERAESFFRAIAEKAPGSFTQAVYAAATVFKSRPNFVIKQPFPKRAAMVRRALARVSSNPVAEEMLAIYYLECRKDILIEWLDALGIEHEEGSLKEDNPVEPAADKLELTIKEFCGKDDDLDRGLLLKAFASQPVINWPVLDAYNQSH